MLYLDLQFFGGRGSSGGKQSTQVIVQPFSSLEAADDFFRKETEKYNYTQTLTVWSSDRYKIIGEELRKDDPDYDRTVWRGMTVGDAKHEMDYNIKRSQLTKPIVTYRIGSNELLGFKPNEKITLEKLQKKGLIGATVSDKNYLATSVTKNIINDHIAKRNAKNATIFRITINPGKGKGIYIKPYALSPEQGEYTLKRNAPLKIKGVHTDKATGRQVVDLEW